MLKIKKTGSRTSKKNDALKEVLREDKKALYAQVDNSIFWKLKDILTKRKISYIEWLIEKISHEQGEK